MRNLTLPCLTCVFGLLISSLVSASVIVSGAMANGITYSFNYSDNNSDSVLTSNELIDFSVSENSGAGYIFLDVNDIVDNTLSWTINNLDTGFDAIFGEFYAKRTVVYSPGWEDLALSVDSNRLRWNLVRLNARYIGYHDIGDIEAQVTSLPTVPAPAAVWLFGSGLIGLIGVARRKKA